jgi:hypothetical protein
MLEEILLIVVHLSFLEELPALVLGLFPLEGTFTVLEEMLFLVGLLFSEALLFLLVGLPFVEELPPPRLGSSSLEGSSTILEGSSTDLEEILLFLVGHLFSETLLFLLVGLPFVEELPPPRLGSSPLEGPSTVLEEILLFLVGFPFSESLIFLSVGLSFLEELPTLIVGPFLLEGYLILFKERRSFVVGVSFLHGILPISNEYFTIVVDFSVMLGHLTITEEFVLTVRVSVSEGPVTQWEKLLPLKMGLPPWKDISHSWTNFPSMVGLPFLQRYHALLEEILLLLLGPLLLNELLSVFSSWSDSPSQWLEKEPRTYPLASESYTVPLVRPTREY